MSQAEMYAANPYAQFGRSVADAPTDVRVDFIRKTYTHLAAAIYTFVALEWAMFRFLPVEDIVATLFGGTMQMLLLLGGFIVVSWIADRWARSSVSPAQQYMGLGLYIVAEAIIFMPILYIAQDLAISVPSIGPVNVIAAAAVATLLLFGALTAFVWLSNADFSFLRTGLFMAGIAAFALIVASMLFGWNLGIWFSVAMIAFACGWILYDTSNVLHVYQPGQHVAAALALFASVALLFWWILRLMMAFSSRD